MQVNNFSSFEPIMCLENKDIIWNKVEKKVIIDKYTVPVLPLIAGGIVLPEIDKIQNWVA